MPGRKVFGYAICGTIAALGVSIALAAAQQSTRPGPFTAEQATAGRAIYQATCSTCHLPDLKGTFEAPPLSGANFMNMWRNRPTSDLFTRIRTSMPISNPGSLSDEEAVNLVAYILQANGATAGTQALTPATIVPIGAVTTGAALIPGDASAGGNSCYAANRQPPSRAERHGRSKELRTGDRRDAS